MRAALPRLDRGQPEPLGVRLCNWVGEVVLMMPTLRRLEDAGYQMHLVGRGWARALLEGTGWSVYKRPNSLLEARRTWRAAEARPRNRASQGAIVYTLAIFRAGNPIFRLATDRPLERWPHATSSVQPIRSRPTPMRRICIGISRLLRSARRRHIRQPRTYRLASAKGRRRSSCLNNMACGLANMS
jgi:hypothetical protein